MGECLSQEIIVSSSKSYIEQLNLRRDIFVIPWTDCQNCQFEARLKQKEPTFTCCKHQLCQQCRTNKTQLSQQKCDLCRAKQIRDDKKNFYNNMHKSIINGRDQSKTNTQAEEKKFDKQSLWLYQSSDLQFTKQNLVRVIAKSAEWKTAYISRTLDKKKIQVLTVRMEEKKINFLLGVSTFDGNINNKREGAKIGFCNYGEGYMFFKRKYKLINFSLKKGQCLKMVVDLCKQVEVEYYHIGTREGKVEETFITKFIIPESMLGSKLYVMVSLLEFNDCLSLI